MLTGPDMYDVAITMYTLHRHGTLRPTLATYQQMHYCCRVSQHLEAQNGSVMQFPFSSNIINRRSKLQPHCLALSARAYGILRGMCNESWPWRASHLRSELGKWVYINTYEYDYDHIFERCGFYTEISNQEQKTCRKD